MDWPDIEALLKVGRGDDADAPRQALISQRIVPTANLGAVSASRTAFLPLDGRRIRGCSHKLTSIIRPGPCDRLRRGKSRSVPQVSEISLTSAARSTSDPVCVNREISIVGTLFGLDIVFLPFRLIALQGIPAT